MKWPRLSVISLPLLGFVLLLAIMGIYSNSLSNPFYYDDIFFIKENPGVAQIGNFRYLFSREKYFALFRLNTYRPLTSATYLVLNALLRDHVWGWRLFNLLLHFGNCLLFYLILRRQSLSPPLPLLAALLFAAHPVHTESINVISFNTDIMGSFFCLLAFWGYYQPARYWLWLAPFCFFLSCLVKETFIMLPLVLLVFDSLEAEARGRIWRRQLPYGIAILVFLSLNFLVMTNPFPTAKIPYPGGSLFSALLTFSVVVVYYLKLFIAPFKLTPIYDFPLYTTVFHPQVLFALLVWISLLALIFYGYQRKDIFSAHLSWFFLFLIPTSNVIPFWGVIAERYLYLPLMGLIATMVLLAAKGLKKEVMVTLLSLAIIYFGVLTIKRNEVWSDPERLWLTTIDIAPQASRPHLLLGGYYEEERKFSKAEEQYQWLIKNVPTAFQPYFHLGNIYRKLGLNQQARQFYEKALTRAGSAAFFEKYPLLNNLGGVCFNLADYQLAEKYWRQARLLMPDDPTAAKNLEFLYDKRREGSKVSP